MIRLGSDQNYKTHLIYEPFPYLLCEYRIFQSFFVECLIALDFGTFGKHLQQQKEIQSIYFKVDLRREICLVSYHNWQVIEKVHMNSQAMSVFMAFSLVHFEGGTFVIRYNTLKFQDEYREQGIWFEFVQNILGLQMIQSGWLIKINSRLRILTSKLHNIQNIEKANGQRAEHVNNTRSICHGAFVVRNDSFRSKQILVQSHNGVTFMSQR